MSITRNNAGTATGVPADLGYYRLPRAGRPTDLDTRLVENDIEVWQRAVERAHAPGETIPLDRVIERLDAPHGDDEG